MLLFRLFTASAILFSCCVLGAQDAGFTTPSEGFQSRTAPVGGASPPATASPAAADPPSMTRQPSGGVPRGPASTNNLQLPREAGQMWEEYDLTPYTGYLTGVDRPHQAVIDWILRETGTDVWFASPFGILSARRDTLTVYHTSEMQQVVAKMVSRFVAGPREPQSLNLKVMRVGNPNWRGRALPLLTDVYVETPGVQAWLVNKENAALLMSMLKQRTDANLMHDVDLIMYNGQSQQLGSRKGRNYVRSIRASATGWPPYEPELGEVQEGYELSISPLVSEDRQSIDIAVRAEIDQVEKLVAVDLDLPLPNGQNHRARIDVPQMVSWRLHERFRWPADQVLLLSCGVVATPDESGMAIPGLDLLTGTTHGRADALLFIEYRGSATDEVRPGTRTASPAIGVSRGRY